MREALALLSPLYAKNGNSRPARSTVEGCSDSQHSAPATAGSESAVTGSSAVVAASACAINLGAGRLRFHGRVRRAGTLIA